MTGNHRILAALTACAALCSASSLSAQSGSILSDLSSEEVQSRYREEAATKIACEPLSGYDAEVAAFAVGADQKWDRAVMGCAVEYGATAMEQLALPTSPLWALVTFRADNIETHLKVFGAHVEYFDVLDKTYSDHYQGIELSSELALRWERNRARAETLLARIEPIVPKITEARILRAAYNLASTLRETPTDQQSAAITSAIEDLRVAIEEKPEALDGLAQLLLGQVLAALPEFLGGDIDTAIGLLEQAHALNPDDLSIHRALAEAYLGERETEKAVALLQSALEIDISRENPQDYVDDMQFLGGLALRADQPELAAGFGESRAAMLADQPFLDPRKESAAMGHGGENPFSGKDPSDLN